MDKIFLLGANKSYDRSQQVVQVNQIIHMEGYNYDKYVVYDITSDKWGITYKLICLRTRAFFTTDIVRPLNEKFGIGYYYNSDTLELMDSFEVAGLLQEAQQIEKAEQEEEDKEKARVEAKKAIGRVRLAEIMPQDAQAIIIARLKKDESDSQSDYFASSTQRTVILGFSTHKRDLFSEMRKHASNFEPTTYLAEYNAEYEHREKYSMGAGYYLGESKYSGWIIEKSPIIKRESAIEYYAYTAGYEENICIKTPTNTNPPNSDNDKPTTNNKSNNNCSVVEYSDKAIAVFGETKAIKEELKAMGGRFNNRLTFNGEKLAGWVFPKSKEEKLALFFGLN